VGGGGTASARVFIAREGNAETIDFDTSVNDVQDGCSNPQNAVGTSADAGAGAQPQAPTAPSTTILTPGGTPLNPNLQAEPGVFIGARPSDRFRSQTPGLIFAQCDNFAQALPGIVYDTDNVVVYWSWFARDAETMQQHLDNAQYSVKMNTAPFPQVKRSEPTEINGDLWVFYTAEIGNLRPGHYEIEYRLNWANPISDGYDDFGPGTGNPQDASQCNFDVERNPAGQDIFYNMMYTPTDGPVHDIVPEF
jgi:hypothetical protein